MILPLAQVLATYRPTDMIPCDVPVDAPLAAQWAAVWDSIERNHVALDPSYWTRFAASVLKRQHEPVHLQRLILGGNVVANGHHRLWDLHKAGATRVRVCFV